MEPLFDTSFVLSSPIYMSHNSTRDLLFSMGAPSSWKMMDALLQWLSILVLSCLHGFAISLHHIQASKLDMKDKKEEAGWRFSSLARLEKFSCFPSGLFSQKLMKVLSYFSSRTELRLSTYPSKSLLPSLYFNILSLNFIECSFHWCSYSSHKYLMKFI